MRRRGHPEAEVEERLTESLDSIYRLTGRVHGRVGRKARDQLSCTDFKECLHVCIVYAWPHWWSDLNIRVFILVSSATCCYFYVMFWYPTKSVIISPIFRIFPPEFSLFSSLFFEVIFLPVEKKKNFVRKLNFLLLISINFTAVCQTLPTCLLFLQTILQMSVFTVSASNIFYLKVPSGQIGSAWEWYHWKAL